jgi:hypothetical protein
MSSLGDTLSRALVSNEKRRRAYAESVNQARNQQRPKPIADDAELRRLAAGPMARYVRTRRATT